MSPSGRASVRGFMGFYCRPYEVYIRGFCHGSYDCSIDWGVSFERGVGILLGLILGRLRTGIWL